MSVDIDAEMESKIKAWAEKSPKFRRFLTNMPMLASLYAKHHKPEKVKDCIVDQEAKLELLITKKYNKSKQVLCVDCFRKEGPEEAEECGKSEFDVFYAYNYLAGDETGEIKVSFPPWYEHGNPELDEEEIYVVEGTISEWKGKKQISVTSEIKKVLEDNSEAMQAMKELLEMHDGEIPSELIGEAMEGFEGYMPSIFKELNLEEKDGKIRVAS